jgi:hypothetical protein
METEPDKMPLTITEAVDLNIGQTQGQRQESCVGVPSCDGGRFI